MALKIPTTRELSDQNLAGLEGKTGQTAPLTDKAFLRVMAAMEALAQTGLYKFAAERAKQNFALTASGADLDFIGSEFNVIRKPAESAVLAVNLSALDGTLIPATASFIGDANGVRYFLDASAIAAGGVAALSMTSEDPGAAGNLQPGDTVTIVSPIAGASATGTVDTVTTTGADEETDAAYRPRVLFAERATTGGSNATDYKIWAEEVAGVFRAFPYAGKPPVGLAVSYPGDRTVFVEADVSINPDGIPPASLLDDVRDALNTDPETGLSRPALGLIDSTLYVEPIIRTGATVEIKALETPAGQEAEIQADIETALNTYFENLVMFIAGVDLLQERNDLITDLTIADIVQDVLTGRGASATRVRFKLDTTPYISSYRLEPGELVKLTSVVYVA